MKQLLEGDSEINKKQVLKSISDLGSYAMFQIFEKVTNYSQDKKNIPSIVNTSCKKGMDIRLLESIIKNDEFTGYYDMNSRVFKKVMDRTDLLSILILERNAQMTPAIENICSEEAKQMFSSRDLNNKLNNQLDVKSKVISRKI